jgi:hypothetical protein
MTGLTELSFGIDRNRLAGLVAARVTVDALGEAVVQPAYTVSDGLVSAMFEKVHVIATYKIGRRHTAIQHGSLGSLGYKGTLCHYLRGRKQHPRQQNQKVPVADE